jgi:hypothetical protein
MRSRYHAVSFLRKTRPTLVPHRAGQGIDEGMTTVELGKYNLVKVPCCQLLTEDDTVRTIAIVAWDTDRVNESRIDACLRP